MHNNLVYIGNIEALRAWYTHVRSLFVRDVFDQAVLDGGILNLNRIHAERIKRLGAVAEKMEFSMRSIADGGGKGGQEWAAQHYFASAWKTMESSLCCNVRDPDPGFIDAVRSSGRTDYMETIRSMDAQTRAAGNMWLQTIVDDAKKLWSYDG